MNVEAFFSLSYGLYVVSAESRGHKNGYVANTAFQVTATPPQLAISCNKDNLSSQIIAESGYFSLSVLEKDASKDIIGRFGYRSGKDEQKFEKTKYFTSPNGTPVVTEDCVAWFECKVVRKLDVGTHILFIGEVLDGEFLDEQKEPITYAYYRQVRHGLSPKNAPTYIDKSKLAEKAAGDKTAGVGTSPMQKWECQVCGHIYDPAIGDPDSGIAPGTPFEDLPDDWACPDCGAEKADFQPLDEVKEAVQEAAKDLRKWECQVCGHIYDPAEGDTDSGIAPGTPFEDLPDDWICPDCGAEKADFQPMEEKEEQQDEAPEKPAAATKDMKKWKCEVCGHIYDPAEGDPDGGIAPGTAFEDIPDDWYCPICGAGKEDFVPLD